MKSFAKFTILGRVGNEPEYKETPNYKQVRLSVAENVLIKSENKEITHWHELVAWGSLAEIIHKYLKKGAQLYGEGRIVQNNFTKDTGEKVYKTELRLTDIFLLGKKSDVAKE